jgi:hypothetical protein
MAPIPRTIDAFIARVEHCKTSRDVFLLLAGEIAREGYDSLIVASCNAAGDHLSILHPGPSGPEAEIDARRRLGFHNDLTTAADFATPAWIEACALAQDEPARPGSLQLPFLHSAAGELTIPFHRAGDLWDIVSMTDRPGARVRGNRHTRVKLKAYASVQRHTALLRIDGGSRTDSAVHDPRVQHGLHSHAAATPICEQEGRALALIDVSWRRYSAGLVELNRRVPTIVGEARLDDYLGRGLIREEADDLRFNYVFRPTRAGQSQLRICPLAAQWRRDVWTKYVEVHERPLD